MLSRPPLAATVVAINPVAAVIVLSVVIGFAMVVVFRYTSNQKAIRAAKDRLKAQLLAVRLFQDQLPVVLRAYVRIFRESARYLRVASKPLLLVIIPITLLIVYLDRYLGATALQPSQSFLLKVRTAMPEAVDQISLHLPAEIAVSAPPVHIPAEKEVVWRLVAERKGRYNVNVAAGDDQMYSKEVVVSDELSRLSPERVRGPWWKRFFISGEPGLPDASPIEAITVNYPSRNIRFAWIEWNWIVLFFVISLAAGFIFKEVLGIEI